MQKLANSEPLPGKIKDHFLKENWKDYRECHIKPDWLLIYRVTETEESLLQRDRMTPFFKEIAYLLFCLFRQYFDDFGVAGLFRQRQSDFTRFPELEIRSKRPSLKVL